MTVEQLSIAFINRLPIVLAMPNKPRLKYSEILFIEYSRQKAGNKRVNAGLLDERSLDKLSPSSTVVARLKYIEPCLNDYSDNDGETYSFNTDSEDYANIKPLKIDPKYKAAFDKIKPVKVTIEANKLNSEMQRRLIGCVANDKILILRFRYIKRLRIYLDQNREPFLQADFDIGVEIPIENIRIITIEEYLTQRKIEVKNP